MTSQSAYWLFAENRIVVEKNDKQQILHGNFPLMRSLASLSLQNKCLKRFNVTMTPQSAYCLSRENRILDKKTIDNRYYSVIFQLMRPLAYLPAGNKYFENV